MNEASVIYELDGGVARIVLNRPDQLNAVTAQMGEELLEAVARAALEARAVVLTGQGRAFCSGASLTTAGVDLSAPSRDIGLLLERYYNPFILALKGLDAPVITAVRGAAAGIGAAFAMAGDIVLCAEDAYFLQAFRHVGLSPDGGSSYLLAQAVGRIRAMELMLLGERLPAQKAMEWGLVTRVVPGKALDDTAMDLARNLAAGPRSIGIIKKVAWSALDLTLEGALALEREAQRTACRTDDFLEGVSAFADKRPPTFTGT